MRNRTLLVAGVGTAAFAALAYVGAGPIASPAVPSPSRSIGQAMMPPSAEPAKPLLSAELILNHEIGAEVPLSQLLAASTAAMRQAGTSQARTSAVIGVSAWDLDYRTGDVRLVAGNSENSVTLLRVGSAYYMSQLPPAVRATMSATVPIPVYPAGKTWLRAEASADDRVSRFVIEMTDFAAGLVDLSLLDLPNKEARMSLHAGGMTVFEVPFTALDTSAYYARLTSRGGSAMSDLGGPAPMTVRLVFADRLLPERIEFELGPTNIQRITFSRWGEPTGITVPPQAEVVTVAELQAG